MSWMRKSKIITSRKFNKEIIDYNANYWIIAAHMTMLITTQLAVNINLGTSYRTERIHGIQCIKTNIGESLETNKRTLHLPII